MMKKELAILSTITMIGCATPVMASDEAPTWIIKGAYDVFSIDTTMIGYNGDAGITGGETDIDGDLTGGTFSIGKIMGGNDPKMLMFDVSVKSGDLDGEFNWELSGSEISTYFDVQRDDFEANISYQWLNSRWQPFVSIGYWKMDQDSVSDDSTYINGAYYEGIDWYDQLIDSDSINLGAGLNVIIKSVDFSSSSLTFSAKANGDVLFASATGDRRDNQGTIYELLDDESVGYRWKATAYIGYDYITASNNILSVFLEGGYQQQTLEFTDSYDDDWDLGWEGTYVRGGVAMLF